MGKLEKVLSYRNTDNGNAVYYAEKSGDESEWRSKYCPNNIRYDECAGIHFDSNVERIERIVSNVIAASSYRRDEYEYQS